MNKDKFKLFIKEARLKAKLTQQELALILNVDVTAVSKWERGVSYPDITLLQDICNVLEISEKELLGSKKDDEYRQVKNDANKFNKIKDTIFFVSTICYLVAIISCFIINIATKQTLSWFFVVLASCLCGFTFIPTCLRFFNKNKLLIYVTSTYLGLLILFFTISIYTKNYWCFIASIGTLLFYILVFYPILFHKYFNHFKKYFLLTYSLLMCLFTVVLLLITNTYIHIELIKGFKLL